MITRLQFCGFMLGAVLAAMVAEIAVGMISPSRLKREVEDGIRDLERSDPHVLAISSSHGRSFHVLGEEIERRTNGAVSMVAFAVDAGKMRPMDWVLHHRVAPLLDERDSAGQPKRNRLNHLILGVTWWDSCRREPPPPVDHNVISRAWTWPDYLSDLALNGFTAENRNFLRYRVQRIERLSRLVQIQGIDALQPLSDKVLTALLTRLPRETAAGAQAAAPVQVTPELARWRADIEAGGSCLLSPWEREALERIEKFSSQRGLVFTVVLFPLMPQTVTPAGKLTLQRFAELMRKRGEALGYRVIDMSLLPMLSDADFMRDMDHLSPSGNTKFVAWALEHDLAFLLESLRPVHAGGARNAP
jgi:hypothetical protein